jgi:UDP-3-O-[3-hydroxymyristoyl] glucosamine N-acyltransferase
VLSTLTILEQHGAALTAVGPTVMGTATVCNVPEEAAGESLVFATDEAQLCEARLRRPAILIVQAKLADAALLTSDPHTACFAVESVAMGMALLLRHFDQKRIRFAQWGPRHPTAVVHADAVIGENVFLGPYCVIGAGAVIGADCLIGGHSVIENLARIGPRSIIHPHVFVGAACELGSDCEVHPHTSIGSDGFGYAMDSDGRPRKIAHLGNVRIGDAVEIGSNCAVDRATLTSTHIRAGTKLDNICHIAHNCDLGENGFFTAGFMMGGSTKIGRRFVTGGNSVVTAHITIGDSVVLAGRSTVTNDIPEAGLYGGYPLQPLKEAMKTIVNIGRLNEIRRNLNRVMKHLHLTDKAREPTDA